MLEQLRTSIMLHNTQRVLLVAHVDCGAYRRERAACTTHERAFLTCELRRAAAVVRASLPGQRVHGCLLDFEGALWL